CASHPGRRDAPQASPACGGEGPEDPGESPPATDGVHPAGAVHRGDGAGGDEHDRSVRRDVSTALVVVGTAVVAAVVAGLLSPAVAASVEQQPAWLGLRVHIVLAAAAGAGAGFLADGAAELVAFAATGV